jgi:anti-anti-sigma factor
MDNDDLRVEVEHRSGLSMLRITGELDAQVSDSFAARARAVTEKVTAPLVIDLSGLAYLDARGAAVLTEVIRALPPGQLAGISGCPPRVHRVLRLAGLPPLARWLADGLRAQLSTTRIRAASTRERSALIREQSRQARASSQAVRGSLRHSRPG